MIFRFKPPFNWCSKNRTQWRFEWEKSTVNGGVQEEISSGIYPIYPYHPIHPYPPYPSHPNYLIYPSIVSIPSVPSILSSYLILSHPVSSYPNPNPIPILSIQDTTICKHAYIWYSYGTHIVIFTADVTTVVTASAARCSRKQQEIQGDLSSNL